MESKFQDKNWLKKVLARLRPDAPAGNGKRHPPYQDGRAEFSRRLRWEVERAAEMNRGRLMLTGQIGGGKSSELARLAGGWSGGQAPDSLDFFLCDLEKDGMPRSQDAGTLTLVLLRDVCSRIDNRLSLEPPGRELSRIAQRIEEFLLDGMKGRREGDCAVIGSGRSELRVPLSDRGLLPKIGLPIANLLRVAPQFFEIAGDPAAHGLAADLLNELLAWRREASNRNPVLLIDHTDKIRDPKALESLLHASHPLWRRIHAAIIMTVPFEFTMGEWRDRLEEDHGEILTLPPVPYPALAHSEIPAFYSGFVADSGLTEHVDPEALRLLAHYSGGIPRVFISLLRATVKEAAYEQLDRVTGGMARSATLQESRKYREMPDRLMEVLDGVAASGRGYGTEAARPLFHSPMCLVMTDPAGIGPGDSPVRVHPLAQDSLEIYRLSKRLAKAS